MSIHIVIEMATFKDKKIILKEIRKYYEQFSADKFDNADETE